VSATDDLNQAIHLAAELQTDPLFRAAAELSRAAKSLARVVELEAHALAVAPDVACAHDLERLSGTLRQCLETVAWLETNVGRHG